MIRPRSISAITDTCGTILRHTPKALCVDITNPSSTPAVPIQNESLLLHLVAGVVVKISEE
jgi:alpha-galactosidase/6-phospho-beta-glucosidase family protein